MPIRDSAYHPGVATAKLGMHFSTRTDGENSVGE